MAQPTKTKVIIPYAYVDDFKLLKTELQHAFNQTKQVIGELQPSASSKTLTQMTDRLEAFLLSVADKYTGFVETRPDKEVTEKRKVEKPVDQGLIKYNEANMQILKEAVGKYNNREVHPMGPLVQFPEPEHLKMKSSDGRVVQMTQFKKDYVDQMTRIQGQRIAQLGRLEKFGADKGFELAREAHIVGNEILELPNDHWDFVDN